MAGLSAASVGGVATQVIAGGAVAGGVDSVVANGGSPSREQLATSIGIGAAAGVGANLSAAERRYHRLIDGNVREYRDAVALGAGTGVGVNGPPQPSSEVCLNQNQDPWL